MAKIGYPYITLQMRGYEYTPVKIDWHPAGYEQVSDTRPADEDRMKAKQVAVAWANELQIPYKVNHG